jgi:hypothetical protein
VGQKEFEVKFIVPQIEKQRVPNCDNTKPNLL